MSKPHSLLEIEPRSEEITLKLRDCKFMEFKADFDLATDSVYDLMSAVAAHHNHTITPTDVTIYTRDGEDAYREITDFTAKLISFGCKEFYYDFTPVSASLLVIPQ